MSDIADSSNGRTSPFGGVNWGSNPWSAADCGRILHMKEITLYKQWIIKAPVEAVAKIINDFEKFPEYFPKVAEKIEIKKREGNYLEMDAVAKSFGKKLPVKMKTEILPRRGFISDNDSPEFGTSGHEELLLSGHPEGTLVDYTY